MTRRRTLEVGLAAAIALGAGFAAFVPGSLAGVIDLAPALNTAHALMDEEPRRPLSPQARAIVTSLMPEAHSRHDFSDARREGGGVALRVSRDQMDFSVRPRIESLADDQGEGRTLGFQVSAEAETDGQRWWLVAGAERETYVVAPGAGFRDLNLAHVGGSAAVGDAHIGIAFEVAEDAYASIGYVQQRRRFQLGTEDWEEEDHYIGAAFRARW